MENCSIINYCCAVFTFSIWRPSIFNEALVQTEIVTDAVAPSSRRVVVACRYHGTQRPIDVAQHQTFMGRREDCHRDQRYVRLMRRDRAAACRRRLWRHLLKGISIRFCRCCRRLIVSRFGDHGAQWPWVTEVIFDHVKQVSFQPRYFKGSRFNS